MDYPEKFLRGLQNGDCITKEGSVSASAFQFHDNNKRQSDFKESSINWFDDDGAAKEILEKAKINKKNQQEEFQFKYGYLVLNKKSLDFMITLNTCKDKLCYERYPIEDNKYHGNLLINKNLSKQTERLISANIGATVVDIIKRD